MAIGVLRPGYQYLACRVLCLAFSDARSASPKVRARARDWLLGDSARVRLWLALAGVSRDQVRRALARAEGHERTVDTQPVHDNAAA